MRLINTGLTFALIGALAFALPTEKRQVTYVLSLLLPYIA